MGGKTGFQGFSEKTEAFWRGLTANNNKQWFDEHRDDYEEQVLAPARLFVEAMGKRLGKIAPQVQAIPKVNQSLFRINRDVRFSADKSPYKTHMGIWMWEGEAKRMECSGFYFHLEPGMVMLGCGMYMIPRPLLDAFRAEVADPKRGPALARAVNQLQKAGYGIGTRHYKRVPRGYPADHPRAELLRHNGLTARFDSKVPKEFHSAELVDWCMAHYQAMAPLHRWLLAFTQRAQED